MNIGKKGHRVLLASYSWADDARKWDSMSHEDRYTYALDNVAIVHAGNNLKERQRIKDLCVFKPGLSPKKIAKNKSKGYVDGIKGAATVSWMQNPYAFGEAAIFYPGQLALLHDHICAPEWKGRLHIAGEHASLKHAWIEGAIESAIRSALAVNNSA